MVDCFDIVLIDGRMRWYTSGPKLSLNIFDRRQGFSSGRFFSFRFRMNNVLLQKLLARVIILSRGLVTVNRTYHLQGTPLPKRVKYITHIHSK